MNRHIRQIELTDDAYNAAEILRNRNGMTQKEMLARLITWVASLEPASQQLVLGRLPIDYVDDAATHLARDAVSIAQQQYGALEQKRPHLAAKASGKTMTIIHELPDPDAPRKRRRGSRKSR